MMHVVAVTHVRDYVLHLAFSDGTEGDADLRAALRDRPALLALQDGDLFAHVMLDGGTVA